MIMKKDTLGTKMKVLCISILLVSFVIVMYVLDKELGWGFEKIISCILISVYVFFLTPTIKYIINWFSTLSAEESFYAGFDIGYFGIIELILIDPFVGMMYYLNKRFTKKSSGGNNIVMVGWYLVN